MPKMVFEGDGKSIVIHSENEKLVIRVEGQEISIPFDEAEQLAGWIRHQIIQIQESKPKRLPAWKRLLTFNP